MFFLNSNPDPDKILKLINIFSSSGLNEKKPDLAVLCFKLKSTIMPSGKVDQEKLALVLDYCNNLNPRLKNLIDHASNLIMENTIELNKNRLKNSFKTGLLKFSFEDLKNIDSKLVEELEIKSLEAENSIKTKSGYGKSFLGWLDLPFSKTDEIITSASQVKTNSDAVVFIGIGGSYLGSKAVISALLPENYNLLTATTKVPEIYFAGQNLSTKYLLDLISILKKKKVTLIPISKSGTTTEPAVAFRILKNELEKLGNKINVIAITDKEKGTLKDEANRNGWKTFVIPDDVGGRFSVFSPVGLLPISIAGINIDDLLNGAKSISSEKDFFDSARAYAIYRQAKHLLGKEIEILSSFSPYLTQIAEWWKQLFGESEGKDGKGIFISSTTFTTDLHSLGQLIQDGKRNIFETFLTVEEKNNELSVAEEKGKNDPLAFLAGKSPDYINEKAFLGTMEAHEVGKTPSINIALKKLDAKSLGALIYWWEYACALSAYMQEVNPFDQPGVEEYKSKMFKLLGKK